MSSWPIAGLPALGEYILYKTNIYQPGMNAVPRPEIDHNYVRDLEDRVAYLERKLTSEKERYEFIYPFAAHHIIQTQLGREQSAVQELLDSLSVMAVLTEPTYKDGIKQVLSGDYYSVLRRMVTDWNEEEKQ